jgi:predicted  nucleic acid-binding Zn-ribbon protein
MVRPKCDECGTAYSVRRKELGYSTCLDCGEEAVQSLIQRMKKQCAPAYNKGPYMYITGAQMARDLGR